MLFLGGNEHSVKVSSNSEMVRAGVLFENFGDYRELILTCSFPDNSSYSFDPTKLKLCR